MNKLPTLLACAFVCGLAVAVSAQTPEQTNQGSTKGATQPADGSGNSSLPKPGTKGGQNVKPDPAGAASLTAKDREFIMKVAEANTHEIEMGKMAEKQAQSADVKEFGRRMVQDHTAAGQRLMALAAAKGIKPPKKSKMDHGKMGGSNFDKEYMTTMVQDHESTVREFETAAKSGGDNDVQGFAKQTLPTLREHLALAKKIAGKMR